MGAESNVRDCKTGLDTHLGSRSKILYVVSRNLDWITDLPGFVGADREMVTDFESLGDCRGNNAFQKAEAAKKINQERIGECDGA
jgi:hypothetical protein